MTWKEIKEAIEDQGVTEDTDVQHIMWCSEDTPVVEWDVNTCWIN